MPDPESRTADLSALRIPRDTEDNGSGKPGRRVGAVVWPVALLLLLAVAGYLLKDRLLPAPTVEVATVTAVLPSQADAVLTASGYVVAQRKAAVASKGTGRIEYLGVEEGDHVQAGQIIARLEHADVDAALAQARANAEVAQAALAQAQAELRDATLSYERQKKLLAGRTVSQSDFDAAEARYGRAVAAVASAEAGIKAAQAAVRAAEVEVENTNIRAPFDGTVLRKNADVGEVVAPLASAVNTRAAVVSMADMGSLEVEADVSESNIERVRPGQPCEIVLDAFPDQRYRGLVHKIVPTADRAKATVLTKIRFVERDQRVLPEMSAKVTFLSQAPPEGALEGPKTVVPPAAVVTRGGRKVALVVRRDTVVETPVEPGGPIGGLLEVRRGLSAGDQVVLHPTDRLTTGVKVRIAER